MKEQALVKVELPKPIVEATLTGNWGNVHQEHKVLFVKHLCEALDIPLVMNPFLFIQMKGRMALYAPASAYQMLANQKGVTTEIFDKPYLDKDLMVYSVGVRAKAIDGRFSENYAMVSLKGLSGEDYANAQMKCITKAQRRAIKSLIGLPIPDEDDIDARQIEEALKVDATETQMQQISKNSKDVADFTEQTKLIINEVEHEIKTKIQKSWTPQGEQEQTKVIGTPEEDQLEIKQWREHLSELFLKNPKSPFNENPKGAAQFTMNETGKNLKDLNAVEMEDLESRFYKKYPQLSVSDEDNS